MKSLQSLIDERYIHTLFLVYLMLQLTPEQFEHYRKHKYTCLPPGYIVHRVVIKAKYIFPCQILIILAHVSTS